MESGADQTIKPVNRKRVLVVGDDPETRERVGEALERAGFGLTLAATGERGLVLLREWPRRIDWLYTEAELPGLVDGWILRMSSTEPTRLGPCSMVSSRTRKDNLRDEASP
jgi:CheY-like chemotaxis protein